jgi:hypothetical protein
MLLVACENLDPLGDPGGQFQDLGWIYPVSGVAGSFVHKKCEMQHRREQHGALGSRRFHDQGQGHQVTDCGIWGVSDICSVFLFHSCPGCCVL